MDTDALLSAFMARVLRVDVGGYCYHVLNRANAQYHMFRRQEDFAAFERVLAEAVRRSEGGVELLAYCLMSNHWHLVLYLPPGRDGAMGNFMKWLTTTHAGRYRVSHGQGGLGHLYQGRYKSFLVEADAHLLTVCRYVERNALQASLVERAEDWRWSSLWRWRNPATCGEEDPPLQLSPWPISAGKAVAGDGSGRPLHWLRTVNTPLNEQELKALRIAADRCRPFGSADWVSSMIRRFDLVSTMRGRGRPGKTK